MGFNNETEKQERGTVTKEDKLMPLVTDRKIWKVIGASSGVKAMRVTMVLIR